MTSWFRTFIAGDEDRWQYFEADEEGYPLREVELRAADLTPVTAAAAVELRHLRDHAGLAAMRRYEQQFGCLAEGKVNGWEGEAGARELSAEEFAQLWTRARDALGGIPDLTGPESWNLPSRGRLSAWKQYRVLADEIGGPALHLGVDQQLVERSERAERLAGVHDARGVGR